MEAVSVELSAELYDKAVHGGLDDLPVLPEVPALAVYVKPEATVGGQAGAVITFTVQLPDGSFAHAQAVTTLSIIENLGAIARGWREGGHL